MLLDNLNDPRAQIADLLRRVRDLETASPTARTSITRGALRVASAEGLIVEGSAKVSGTLNVDGTTNLDGPTTISGDTDLTGDFGLTGDLAVTGGGRILVGDVEFSPTAGGAGPGIFAPTGVLVISAVQQIDLLANVGVRVVGDFTVTGAKSFKIPHPHGEGWLQHGSTESPVSGVEYWGTGELDDDGTATVELPHYFDALVKPGTAVVFVTGRGFSPDWSDVDGNAFAVAGTPGEPFTWLVKAERIGADFETESQ